MPDVRQTPTDEEAAAKARLDLIRTQAVGIVDRAANGEMFLVQKSATSMVDPQVPPAVADATKAPEAAAAAAPLKMPAAMKQAMADGLGIVLDRLALMAEKVAAAEADDAAPVPPELLQLAMEAEDALAAMVEPYEEALMAAPPAVVDGAGQAQKAAPAAPAAVASAKRRMAMKRLMSLKDTSKSLTDAAAKLGETIAWAEGAGGMPAPGDAAKLAPATKADLDAYTATQATLQAIRERMWAACEMIAKDPVKAVAELREVAGMLDRAAIMATGVTPSAAPAAPTMAPEAVAAEVTKTLKTVAAELLVSMKADLSPLLLAASGAAARAQSALTKVEKSVGLPQGAPAGENQNPTPAPPPADPWRNVHADIAQARTPAAGK